MTDQNDPLGIYSDQASEGSDTTFPRLKPAPYDLVVAKAEVTSTAKGGERLAITLKTTKDGFDKDGGNLAAGYPIYHNIALTPTDDYPPKNINRNLNTVLKSAGLLKESARSLVQNPTILEGKIVRAKVGLKPERDGYPESNNIVQFVEVK